MANNSPPFDRPLMPLNTWDAVIARLAASREETDPEKRIDLIIEILVNIRLLDKEERIPDARGAKGDIAAIHGRLREETTRTLDSLKSPSGEYLYYFRELLKKLPLRGGGDLIGDIRSAAEHFEEGRQTDDPLRSFASDLRKEVHRKLSPGILARYVKPYLGFILRGDRAPLAKAGYMALAASFNPASEDPEFTALAREMDEKLSYLWDYDKGDITIVKKNLESRLDLFERCFLRKEMETFLAICAAPRIRETHNLVDCLKRLISFKMLLKESCFEGRIGLFDYLNLDLDIGRLIFIFTNDLTNRHYETVTFANFKECAALVKELILLLSQKGIIPERNESLLRDMNEISEAGALDILKAKRIIQGVSITLQQFMQENIFSRIGRTLNGVLEIYSIPSSDILPIKDRFFNNFIRTTEFHAVSEFIEKMITFLNRELAVKSAENSLYGKYKIAELPAVNGRYDDFIACTWSPAPDRVRPFLGGKGNSLIDMNSFGIAIPPAFILGLPICGELSGKDSGSSGFRTAVRKYLVQLEEKTGRKLGCPERPLLVSVRSGAAVSMPGSMCTILNVGITPEVSAALEASAGAAFARNIYLRFLKNTLAALGKPPPPEKTGNAAGLAKKLVCEKLGEDFLSDPFEQLLKCIKLIFASSRSESVMEYLREMSIESHHGTAVTVQQMVFGNKNQNCLSGVIFTRNPINGEDELFGEYKEMTQGEDVVMGNIVTSHIATIPAPVRAGLTRCKEILERRLKHELDLEFTVEDGRLYLLQARRAAVSTYAKLVVDTDMMRKGIISVEEFRRRIERMSATNAFISVPRTGEGMREWKPPVGTGVPINPGTVCGTLVLTREKLEEERARQENVIYFAQNTNPSDFYIINNSHGIITVFPGMTSHAAITSMTLNKPCVVGCASAVIDLKRRTVSFKGQTDAVLKEGELITLDANSGCIYRGAVPLANSFIKTHNILDTLSDAVSPTEAADEVWRILREKISKLEKEMGTNKKSLASMPKSALAGKNVLVRLDMNVPLSKGAITDPARIEAAMPTIKHLLDAGATPVLCSHLGDPDKLEKKGKPREEIYYEYSLKPVAEYLRKRLGAVTFHENSIASSGLLMKKEDIVKGSANLLQNLRFALGEKENDAAFARGLAGLSDGIFVNDAFGTCHRSHASITGVTQHVRTKLAGFLIEKELKYLGDAVANPKRPFAGIIGGSKISSKLGVIESLLQKLDLLIVGGGIGYTLLKATGFDVQRSLVEESMLDTAGKLMKKYGDKIVLPRDFVITDKFDFPNKRVGALERNVKAIREGWESFDLGEASIDHAAALLSGAGTILWNGPIGAFEIPEGSSGTIRLSRALAKLAEKGKIVIIGGGDSAAAVALAGVADKMTHVSTGGGASLEFLERLTLPGISALDPE